MALLCISYHNACPPCRLACIQPHICGRTSVCLPPHPYRRGGCRSRDARMAEYCRGGNLRAKRRKAEELREAQRRAEGLRHELKFTNVGVVKASRHKPLCGPEVPGS